MAFEHTAAGRLTRWPVSVTCGHWTVGRPGGGKFAMNSHSKEGFGSKSLLKGPFFAAFPKSCNNWRESFCVGSYG